MDWTQFADLKGKPASNYKTKDYLDFTCSSCNATQSVRLNHAKAKINKLGTFICSICQKRVSINKARKAFKEKHGDVNPFELDSVKSQIKQTNQERYGVNSTLQLKEIHGKGIEAAAKLRENQRGFKYPDASTLTRQQRQNMYHRQRYKKDINYQLRCTSYRFSKRQNNKISYDETRLKAHLEKQFKPGMTWENRETWHIDHIIPLSKFDLTDPAEFKLANSLDNLQPLWKSENLRKSNATPKVVLLVGCFGAGKTTICNKLKQNYRILDKDKQHDLFDVARTRWDSTAIFQTPVRIDYYYKMFTKYFDVELVTIIEDIETIAERLEQRGGQINVQIIKNRTARLKSLAKKYGGFIGTADECLEYLS